MSEMNDLQELAGQVYEQFARDTRDDGTTFWHRKDQPYRGDWVQKLIYDAHGEFLPDDFRYEQIVHALGDFHDNDDPEQVISELEPAPYNATRCQWLASDLRRGSYCDDAMSEYGDQDSIFAILGLGILREMEEVYQSVLESLQNHLEETKSEDDEGEEDDAT